MSRIANERQANFGSLKIKLQIINVRVWLSCPNQSEQCYLGEDLPLEEG